MKKFAFTLAVLFTLFQTNTKAQVMGNAQYNASESAGNSIYAKVAAPRHNDRFQRNRLYFSDSTVQVSVKGLINVLPDTYVATFNIIQAGENPEITDRLMRERIDRFKTNLRGLDVSSDAISTDMISFVPKYSIETENRIFSKNYNEIPAGFEMQKNLSVRYKKSSELDEMVATAAQSEIYDLVKVDCFNSELEKFKDSLRAKCVQDLKNRVKSYESLNLRLDTLKKTIAEDYYVISPETRYSGYQAFARTSSKPEKKGNLTEVAKSVSQYYKAITYEDFDVVMNPVVLEPMIQVTYEIGVTYHLKQAGKYYIITPGGEGKRLILK